MSVPLICFSRYPAAPAMIAWKSASSSEKDVSIRHWISGCAARMSRQTSTPLPSGSRTSSTATSGRVGGIREMASAAVPGLADHLDEPGRLDQVPEAPPDDLVVVEQEDTDPVGPLTLRGRHRDGPPRAGQWGQCRRDRRRLALRCDDTPSARRDVRSRVGPQPFGRAAPDRRVRDDAGGRPLRRARRHRRRRDADRVRPQRDRRGDRRADRQPARGARAPGAAHLRATSRPGRRSDPPPGLERVPAAPSADALVPRSPDPRPRLGVRQPLPHREAVGAGVQRRGRGPRRRARGRRRRRGGERPAARAPPGARRARGPRTDRRATCTTR